MKDTSATKIESPSIKDDRLQAAIATVRIDYPDVRLFQINIPGDDEIYLARNCTWNEYKRLIDAVKNAVTKIQK